MSRNSRRLSLGAALLAGAAVCSIHSLAAAQEALGYLNDVAVGRSRLGEWTRDDALLREAVAFVAGWHAPRIKSVRESILRDTRKLLWGRRLW